jgi:hypothetical protein
MTTKVVMTTRLAEEAPRKGLVAVNLKTKEPKKMAEPVVHFCTNDDVISKDPEVLTVGSVIRF